MSSLWKNRELSLSLFGESHGPGVGAVIEGLPAGTRIDLEQLQAFMARRAPGRSPAATARRESDLPQILSGIVEGVCCGTPIAAFIPNQDTHSFDYKQMSNLARPGHADYTGFLRYHGYNDVRGGGHFSARVTAPLVFAGGLCKQFLAQKGIRLGAHLLRTGGYTDTSFNPIDPNPTLFDEIANKPFPVLDNSTGELMLAAIEAARMDQNSLGGVVECAVTGVPAGLGDPIFGSVENVLTTALFGIPAIKGIEFGEGFAAASSTGVENNDPFFIDETGSVKTRTNHHGGILGGITSGMPILFRVAFKPTPSISRPQETIDFVNCCNATIKIKGRHDPCVAVRAVPCVEAAAALAIASLLI